MLGLKIHTLPKLNKPTMIAALPDMGNVAGIGMDFLVKKLKAKLFAEIYAFWPPAVSHEHGLIKYEQSSYKFYYLQKENLVFFSGEFNPSDPRRLYELCYEVVDMAKKLKVSMLYSIGAALRQPSPTEPKLFAATTTQKHLNLLKKEKLEILNGKGQITGFNGLVLGIAKEKQLDSICILVEIDNPNVIQPKSAKLILAKLLQILELEPLDMKELEEEEKRKQFMEQQMSYMNGLAKKDNQPGIA
ncbi:MAG: PAC2 family protein [Thaumarchaeota archaeon]|nr:PAC2 family protein [Nitrososphaerota archaeon]MDE1866172.1 PAC2 family protein [Nitrososphaerota archaeon]